MAKELGVRHPSVQLWVKRFREEGVQGLEEKRGRGSGPTEGRPKTKQQNLDAELHRLRAENAYLKKLWELQRGRTTDSNRS